MTSATGDQGPAVLAEANAWRSAMAPAATAQAPPALATSAAPPFGADLVRSIGEASKAVASLNALTDSDVTVSAITAVHCDGELPADAFTAAAAFVRQAPHLVLAAVLWARTPGFNPAWDHYRMTLLVTSADPRTGEAELGAHHAEVRARFTVYLDASGLDGSTALPPLHAIDTPPGHAADVFDAAAAFIRATPQLMIQALHWARVPTPAVWGWEHRLTVLAATAPPTSAGEHHTLHDRTR